MAWEETSAKTAVRPFYQSTEMWPEKVTLSAKEAGQADNSGLAGHTVRNSPRKKETNPQFSEQLNLIKEDGWLWN